MAGLNSRFPSLSESDILRMKEDPVAENTKKAMKFGLKVFRGLKRHNAARP